MTELLRERGVFDRAPFVLIDVGCAGGINDAWRAFGPSLVARGYDPDAASCEEAQAREPFQNVRYDARFVGLDDSHPFVQRRKAEAPRWPNTNPWGRITAGYLAARQAPANPGAPRQMADPATLISVDEIVRTEQLPTVDFIKIDIDSPDGQDLDVLVSTREVLHEQRVLGVGVEVNWFGSASPTAVTFRNTDEFMREQGFELFGISVRTYSRTDLPAPFEYEVFAQTRFGQPFQGDAIYVRDLAADYRAADAASYPADKLIKLACIYELVGLPDCAAEVLNRFASRLEEFGDREPLLDALTPPLHGEKLTYREYIERFERTPERFLPSAAPVQPAPPASPPEPAQAPPPPPPAGDAGGAAETPGLDAAKLTAALAEASRRIRPRLDRAARRAGRALRRPAD